VETGFWLPEYLRLSEPRLPGITVGELDGEARDIELKSFVSGDAWYHSADVDNLSKQEAGIIAARLVRRVQAKVALSEEKAKALAAGWAEVVARSFIGPDSSTATRKEELTEQLLKVVRGNLDQSQIAAFQEAIAKGFYPAADDKEEPNSKNPRLLFAAVDYQKLNLCRWA
jgi:hypothetical protein